MENCLSWKGVQGVSVVINMDHIDLYNESANGLDILPPIAGGIERTDSVYNGLKNFPNIEYEDIILIHDAARPFTKPKDIHNLVHSLGAYRAATLATPIVDTLRRSTPEGVALETVPREHLWAIQTPQAFYYGDILTAYENRKPEKKYTDCTSVIADLELKTKLVVGSRDNIKLTTPEDFKNV